MIQKLYNFIKGKPILMKTIIGIVVVILISTIILGISNKYNENLKKNPWVLKNTKTGKIPMTIEQDPKKSNSITIQRTQNSGINFTWGTWLYINDIGKDNNWQHVFHKGSPERAPLYCPGVWLSGNKNSLRVIINTFNEIDVTLDVDNLPIKKWFHLAIYVSQNSFDVWINGNMVQSRHLDSPPKQNWGNVYIAHNGGFNGFISNLRYYAYKLPYYKLENVIKQGPNTSSCIDTGDKPPYFNKDWWLMQ